MLLDFWLFLILPVWLPSWIWKWPFLLSHPNNFLFILQSHQLLKSSAYTDFSLPTTIVNIRSLKCNILFPSLLCVPPVFFQTRILRFEEGDHIFESRNYSNSLLSLHNSLFPNHKLIEIGTESPRGGLLCDKYNMGAVNLIWLNRDFFSANYVILVCIFYFDIY